MTHLSKRRIRWALEACDAAQKAYDAAVSRHDTRDMSTALASLREARHAALAAELKGVRHG